MGVARRPRTAARLLDVDYLESAVADAVTRSSSGAAMTTPAAAVVDSAADARWLAWQTRGAASDRRSGRIMGWVLATTVIVVVGVLLATFRV